jgi:hypothetical protein
MRIFILHLYKLYIKYFFFINVMVLNQKINLNDLIKNNLEYKYNDIIHKLKIVAPNLNDEEIINIYKKSVSIRQSLLKNNGSIFENNIEKLLIKKNILYKKQVTIDDKGIIIGFNCKKERCFHIIDFVIGANIEIGSCISNFKVLSCKTTCRERWTQDEWTFRFPPKKYILLTTSNDYPSSARFKENIRRLIITCNPKKKDDRIKKLNFNDILYHIK